MAVGATSRPRFTLIMIDDLISQANAGDCSAQSQLAAAYYYGQPGVSIDRVKAARWAQLAAVQGDAQAQRILGNCFCDGEGVEKDYIKAVALYREAARQGDFRALFNLGGRYESGEGVGRDVKKAMSCWNEAAESGGPELWYALASKYSNGIGGATRDSVSAVIWLKKAASRGHAQALCDLGMLYHLGEGVRRNQMKALELWAKAAELGLEEAKAWPGVMMQESLASLGSPFEAQFESLIDAAESGNSKAQLELGLYYQGNGGRLGPDAFQAAAWFRRSAEQGLAASQLQFGLCLFNGFGVDQDHAMAAHWYRKAAEQNLAFAQHNLGICYFNGWGVPLDYEQAVFWYSRASLQGDADAQNNLGHCYAMGHGVSTNAVEALAYFILASPHSERARQNAQILRSSSTGELVKQSQERAKQLQREIEACSNSK